VLTLADAIAFKPYEIKAGITISLYCKMPSLKGGSNRKIRASSDNKILASKTFPRGSLFIFFESPPVSLSRNDLAIHISALNSRNLTAGLIQTFSFIFLNLINHLCESRDRYYSNLPKQSN